MKILGSKQIKQKIKRLSIQIVENNYTEKEIILVGINNNGLRFAKMLLAELKTYSNIEFSLAQISLNPKKPLDSTPTLNIPIEDFKKKVIIFVDDVANTGRTLFYAFTPFMSILPKKIEVAVLVNRKHKSFPIKVDYVGMTLATTLKNNIKIDLNDKRTMQALLE